MGRLSVLESYQSQFPIIAPSLLKCDFGNLHREVELLEYAGATWLHLDVMDGHFVPNLSYGPPVIERIRELTAGTLDAHLMISDPDRYLQDYLKAGCDCITVHIEAVPHPARLLETIREHDVVAGLALNPGTPVEAVIPFLNHCDLLLVMSVEPGFGGQTFIPSSLKKLSRLRDELPSGAILSVDGGIDPTTIGPAAAAGADVCVAGSAVFDAVDYRSALTELRHTAQSFRKTAAL